MGCCTLEHFSSSSRAVAGSNCSTAAALSLRLSAACPCPVTNQGAIGVTLDPGALLVVGGPGRGAHRLMGVCRQASLPPPRPPWRCGCSCWGGGGGLALSPLLGGSVHCLATPDRRWGCCPRTMLCCAVLCCVPPCRSVGGKGGPSCTLLADGGILIRGGSWPGLHAS